MGSFDAETLATAVRKARSMQAGAIRIADAFASSGSDTAVVEGVEELMGETAVPRSTAVMMEGKLAVAGPEV
jgi:hypothetical protein